IQDILALPSDLPDDQRPKVRAAGRIVGRRTKGKLHFLDIWDWSGHPAVRTTKEVEGKHEAQDYLTWSSRIQVMIGEKQVGPTGWALAQELDLGDLIAVDGSFGTSRVAY